MFVGRYNKMDITDIRRYKKKKAIVLKFSLCILTAIVIKIKQESFKFGWILVSFSEVWVPQLKFVVDFEIFRLKL